MNRYNSEIKHRTSEQLTVISEQSTKHLRRKLEFGGVFVAGFRVFSPTHFNPIIINFPRSTTGIRLVFNRINSCDPLR